MRIHTVIIATLAVAFSSNVLLVAQSTQFTSSPAVRERAREPYKQGLAYMQSEAFAAAVKAFESAIAVDPTFDMAHYMLGRAHMAQKSYAAAVQALTKAKTVYISEASREFVTKQDGQRHRRDRLAVLDDTLQQLRAQPQTFQIREQIRQLEERKRQVEDMDRNQENTPAKWVPAFVNLSLGSAHFRSGNLGEAEKAYRDALAADPRVGEAHSNLAVVYMETGRFDDADRSVKAAEKVGFKVHPDLKEEIKSRRKAGSN